MQCFKCKKRNINNIHHIDGNGTQLSEEQQNNSNKNLITLCSDCHDIVEGICNQCFVREYCYDKKFKECWAFEDALPPIHFKTKKDIIIELQDSEESFKVNCPHCSSKRICRISKWSYDGVYKATTNYLAFYQCENCKKIFKRTLESGLERANDNSNIPIKIKDWDYAVEIKHHRLAKSRFLESESDEISDIEDDEENDYENSIRI